MGKEKPKSIGVWPAVRPFVNGGASGMLATCVVQLIDMIKKKRYSIIEKAIAEGTGEVVSDAVGDNYVLYDSNQFKKSSKVNYSYFPS
ncbi:mitochondrial dicarboxylate/tricarboxylate transporter DTC-like [Camellia sinensis]|uniref:mitochondrial dicarboxylate/tricarboxylate transporter DTC-like n=1 Tax=Camellia sinensis TaxID=4442 RepID=UPI001035B032|nr:mitochondrial dicarboxylate/tricarboxylate transporter DTC-like [Camellia sinensis]